MATVEKVYKVVTTWRGVFDTAELRYIEKYPVCFADTPSRGEYENVGIVY